MHATHEAEADTRANRVDPAQVHRELIHPGA